VERNDVDGASGPVGAMRPMQRGRRPAVTRRDGTGGWRMAVTVVAWRPAWRRGWQTGGGGAASGDGMEGGGESGFSNGVQSCVGAGEGKRGAGGTDFF
jgi:hypothetical protein